MGRKLISWRAEEYTAERQRVLFFFVVGVSRETGLSLSISSIARFACATVHVTR
jgi:hypothetical protein